MHFFYSLQETHFTIFVSLSCIYDLHTYILQNDYNIVNTSITLHNYLFFCSENI